MTRSPAAEFQLQSLHPHYNYTLAVAAITTDVGPFSYSVEVLTSTARELLSFLIPVSCILSLNPTRPY